MLLLFETYQTKLAWAFYRILFINVLVFWLDLLIFEFLNFEYDDQLVSIWSQVCR